MWRPFFLAVGISMVIFGAECLGVEKMILALRYVPKATPVKNALFTEEKKPSPVPREFSPKPFIPWTLMSTGAVTCLYSFTLHKK